VGILITSVPAEFGIMQRCLFRPEPIRAAELDLRARHALAESLRSVFDACRGHLAASAAAQAVLLTALRTHAVAPAAFAIYTELVEYLFAEEYVTAQQLMNMLLEPTLAAHATPRVVTLDDASLGEGVPALYARTVDDDAGLRVQIAAVDAEELARGRVLYQAAADLLGAAAPDLLGEINHIAHEVVVVRDAAAPGASTVAFDGASTFYLWGAVVLNIARQRNRATLATALAHEAGHAYLLGSTLGAPLVDNDPGERFASPLRPDPRPMDGLVHASFVLARMIWCQDRMLDSDRLSTQERDEVRAARATNHAMFVDSAPVIASQARFNDEGGALWRAAHDWVAQGCRA
jgi:HEXXH motif-containing protein